jgi:hypothetical protein
LSQALNGVAPNGGEAGMVALEASTPVEVPLEIRIDGKKGHRRRYIKASRKCATLGG